MTDNIFDRLLELLQSSGPVNWRLGEEIAGSIAGKQEPVSAAAQGEYEELTRAAQLHVAKATGLEPGIADVMVHAVDQLEWAQTNLRAFGYIIEPIAAKMNAAPEGPLDPILKPLGPAILGMQAGSMVGFMSQRVLGQFDVGLPTLDQPGIFYVVPNIDSFARDNEIDPQQAKLWVALHEVTHHAEFAVPWVAGHFLSLIHSYFAGLEFDASAIAERLETLESPEQLESMMQQPGGIAGLLAGPEQVEALESIQAFMALTEGYADFFMRRAAPELIPDSPRIAESIARRRAEPSQSEQMLQQLMGLELKRDQYRLGAEFCDGVERRWGEESLAQLWDGADRLPTLAELADPVGWAARLL